MDHGIESILDRVAANKAIAGTIQLDMQLDDQGLHLSLKDDGRGLALQRIRNKAIEQGLIDAHHAGTPHQVAQMIFAPGFSTASTVTEVSGRGVGMDVVKKNILALNGTVEIDSAEGYGMKVSVRLPLTLAIMDGMSVRSGDDIYVIPLSFVLESLQPQAADLKTVAGKGQVVNVRGQYLPIVSLAAFFPGDSSHVATDPTRAILVIVEAGGQQLALQVDELIGQQQFVVKNLESNYRKVEGVAGATIMGDGRVALILDISIIARHRQRQAARPMASDPA